MLKDHDFHKAASPEKVLGLITAESGEELCKFAIWNWLLHSQITNNVDNKCVSYLHKLNVYLLESLDTLC